MLCFRHWRHYQYWLITAAATGGCSPARPGQHGSRSLFGVKLFRLPCFVLKNLLFCSVCTISPVLSPDVWWCPHVALVMSWLWLWPAFSCGSFQCKQWTCFRGGWLEGVGEEWEELPCCFVPICKRNLCLCHLSGAWGLQGSDYLVRGVQRMRNLRHLCFCYLEKHLTTFWKNDRACVWSAQNATSFHVCLPLDFAQRGKTAEIFFVLVLALLVAKPLEEEVLLGWGKVCRGSSCPTRLVPVDCSTQREASCCLHPCLGH